MLFRAISTTTSIICTSIDYANQGCDGLQYNICRLRTEFINKRDSLEIMVNATEDMIDAFDDLTIIYNSTFQMNKAIAFILRTSEDLEHKYVSFTNQVHDYVKRVPHLPKGLRAVLYRIKSYFNTEETDNLLQEPEPKDHASFAISLLKSLSGFTTGSIKAMASASLEVNSIFTGLSAVLDVAMCGLKINEIVKYNRKTETSLNYNIDKIDQYTRELSVQKRVFDNNLYKLDDEVNYAIRNFTGLMKAFLQRKSVHILPRGLTHKIRTMIAIHTTQDNVLEQQQYFYNKLVEYHNEMNDEYEHFVLYTKVLIDVDNGLPVSRMILHFNVKYQPIDLYQIIAKLTDNYMYDNVILNCIRNGNVTTQAQLNDHLSRHSSVLTKEQISLITSLARFRFSIGQMLAILGVEDTTHSRYDIITVIAVSEQYRDRDEYYDYDKRQLYNLDRIRDRQPC